MTDINGLTNPFENSVENQNLTQLEKEKQIRDYLEAITIHNYTVPTDIIVSLNQLIADDVVSLGAIDGFNQVLVEAFAFMLPGQFLEFTPDQLLMLSPGQIAALSPDVFAVVTFDLLSSLSLDALGGINAPQIAQIAVDVFSQLTFEMFSALSPDALAAITPLQIAEVLVDVFAVLTTDLLAALSDGALAGVTAAQIAAFPVAEFGALTAAELTNLTPATMAGVTADQIAVLPTNVFSTLSGAQVTALSPAALGGMTADQFAALDPVVLQLLQDNGSVLAITTDGDELDGDLTAASFSIVENSKPVTIVEATSPLGLTLTYTLTGPDAEWFDIVDGTLSFRAEPDFENPQDEGGDNIYDVTVEVSDGVQSDNQTISVTVTNDTADDNITAPVITSNGGLGFASVDVYENDDYVTTVMSEDPDLVGDTIYSIIGGADYLLFDLDAVSGALTFKVAPDYESPQDVGRDNTYDVTVEVSDGLFTDTQSISVSVLNDPIDDNVTAPRITSNGGGTSAQIQVFENQSNVTTVTSYDPDPVGDEIYSIAGGPNANLFDIHAQTGVLTFIDAPDFENPQGVSGNSYQVAIQVSDGLQTDTQSLTVEVLDVDEQAGPANVQYIHERGPNPDPFQIFFGASNTADIFVFDASFVRDGLANIDIQNFDISQDYLVFINFELGGDDEPPISEPGQIFHENSFLGFNHANFFGPGSLDVLQDRDAGMQNSFSHLVVYGNTGPADLANSFGPGFTDKFAAVTDQTDHVLFYADGFDFV